MELNDSSDLEHLFIGDCIEFSELAECQENLKIANQRIRWLGNRLELITKSTDWTNAGMLAIDALKQIKLWR